MVRCGGLVYEAEQLADHGIWFIFMFQRRAKL